MDGNDDDDDTAEADANECNDMGALLYV